MTNPRRSFGTGGDLPSVTEAWLVYGGWAAAAAVVAVLVVRRRDV
ncbi:hypothetical protein [Streptomyces sp. NPDC060194]